MSKNDNRQLANDHMPPDLKKTISERATQQTNRPAPGTSGSPDTGGAKPKQ
ncbi:hypothetical protein KV01_004797 [Salmonella enterica subsp. enterica]|nr:hypothetical protein [Salmonella enterica subsp. enterica]HAF1587212.1 hypothetical protein [Salmonella enterica]